MNVGIAIRSARGLCLDIGNANLRRGERIQFVNSLSQPQTVGELKITGNTEQGCTAYGKDEPGIYHYKLKLVRGSLENSTPAFALAKFHEALTVTEIGASADLDADGNREYFRSCASSEGLHLTIWTGMPLKGKRRWHTYYYLGHDVEPDCSVDEIAAI